MNSMITEAVNSSTFMVLGGDFNENGSRRSITFKFCLDLGLGIKKTIDFIFIGSNLFFTVTGHWICSVFEFFDTNHEAVLVSIGLGGLLDTGFREYLSAKLLAVANKFLGVETHGNVDTMWGVLKRVMVELVNKTFLKHWFSEFHCTKNRLSSSFFGLELLVAKIVKKFGLGDLHSIHHLVKMWSTLDSIRTHAFADLVSLGEKSEVVLGHLSLVHKKYRKSKIHESRAAEKTSIRLAILKCMKNFCSNKGSMIRSILDWPFRKVVLDHLVIDDELILESGEVKINVDKIMED
ncbi:hypothetical protein G9A89_004372 [Geosiphon pyriformis]|nr:hypothetical protein G9A89_004372 [Geosiphon pyriformis]